MATNPRKLSRFLQEIKRRNVHRLMAVYGGTAFIIFEASTMIFPRWGLPDWTIDLVLYLLILGGIITFILGWVYDITPDGVQKTKPVSEMHKDQLHSKPNEWMIASYVSFVVILGLIVLNIIPRAGKKEILEKSIAVLPFQNDSPDQKRMYFIDGTMEAILDNLSKIKDLRVPGRTSVEQYRKNPKPITVVAEEMNVGYVLEGSGHRDGNNVRLFVKLLEGKTDRRIWSRSYDEDIEEIFSLQSEIAQTIALEIHAVIAPEEKQRIEKISTDNLTAYDFYLQGKEELWKFWMDPYDLGFLDKAEELYKKSVNLDSNFAQAFLGLAKVYWERNYIKEYLVESFMDSALLLTNTALSFDKDLAEAYVLRGDYYRNKGYQEQALHEYDMALEINPNSWEAYIGKAQSYQDDDLVNTIANLHSAVSINRGRELPFLLGFLASKYYFAGFFDLSKKYFQEKLNLDNDSVYYFIGLGGIAYNSGNREEWYKYNHKAYLLDSINVPALSGIGAYLSFVGEDEKALVFRRKWLEQLDNTLIMSYRYNGMHRVGYTYWKNNILDEAEYYFNLQLEYCNRSIEIDNQDAQQLWAYLDRAAVYAFRGEREKAFNDLRKFNQRTSNQAWLVTQMKYDPLFESIRYDPEFQQIVFDIEAKYQAEHERVKQWLLENDKL